jgi:uncharacterized DUF497 family protein
MEFRWNAWNTHHIARHGVTPEEAESVVTGACEPFPVYHGDGKWAVWGYSCTGRPLQVLFIDDGERGTYVIHARPLTPREEGLLLRRRWR